MKKILSILLALTLTLSLCVFVNADSESARLVVSDWKQDTEENWLITVDVYYTGTAQAFYVQANELDNFTFVSGKWKIDENDLDDVEILAKNVNKDKGDAVIALSESYTFDNYKIYTYTIKATGNGTADINPVVKSAAKADANASASTTYPVSTTGSKTINVDKFTCNHTWEEKVADEYLKSKATCTDPAVYYKSCSKCHEKSTETFNSGDALGHKTAEKVNAKYLKSAATCSNSAVYYKSCSVCGEKLNETFEYGEPNADLHVWESKYDTTNHWQECSECHQTKDKEAHNYATLKHDANGHWNECACGSKTTVESHTAEEKVADEYLKSEATCSNPAVYYKSCSVCGEKLAETFEYGEPNADLHKWENKSDDTHHWKECSECQKVENKAEHDYTELKYNSTSHWYECSCGKATDHEEHKGGTADCTHKAVCEVCAQEYGKIKHDDVLVFVDRVEATPEADGHIAYYYCSTCGAYFLDADAVTQITEDMTVIRYNKCDSEGHSMATIDCGSDEYHLMICTNDCGTIMTVPHSFGLDGVCRGCGRVLEVSDLDEEEVVVDTPIESNGEEVDTDDTDNANTDNTVENENNPVTGVAFSAVALVAAAAVLIGKRR